MYNLYQPNKDLLQMTKAQLKDFRGDVWVGPQPLDEDEIRGRQVPEPRVIDEKGGALSCTFDELEEIDDLIGRLYVMRKIFTDDGVNVSSTGRTTQVDVAGGFLYLVPRACYVSDNVHLEGSK